VTPSTEHRFLVSPSVGEVSAVFARPPGARALYVFAHGAGAGMGHSFMSAVAEGLAELGVATLRYSFPYMEHGKRAPNRPPILVETVRAAVSEARRLAPDLPLFAGGKSMGGRMTSTAASTDLLPGVQGLAFFGFPLHAAGRPSVDRGAHLADVRLPMLFLQGTRDKLAELDLLRPILYDLGPSASLHVVEGADHGFHVLKRSGRTDDEVMDEICSHFEQWSAALLGAR
jgi:predicted alpha/beta-hydrolase family hydrolase